MPDGTTTLTAEERATLARMGNMLDAQAVDVSHTARSRSLLNSERAYLSSLVGGAAALRHALDRLEVLEAAEVKREQKRADYEAGFAAAMRGDAFAGGITPAFAEGYRAGENVRRATSPEEHAP